MGGLAVFGFAESGTEGNVILVGESVDFRFDVVSGFGSFGGLVSLVFGVRLGFSDGACATCEG